MGRLTGRGASAPATASSIAPRLFVPVAWTAVALMAPLAVGGADPEFTLAYPPPPPPGPTAPSYVPRQPPPPPEPPIPAPPPLPPAPPPPPPNPSPPPRPSPPPSPPPPPEPPTWAVPFPTRDANGDFCVMDFGVQPEGTANAKYGSVRPNEFPTAQFRDESSYVPARTLANASIAEIDETRTDPRARLLGGCPSKRVACVSSGYGGSYTWRDTMTTDQNIIQEDQLPDVEVLAAVFPAQPESSSGPRSWGGDGWGEYHLETELSQGMLLFDTDVYRLSFKDGLVYLAAGTTCQPERRARLACPDKYWLNGTMVPDWEEVQRTNFSLVFDGVPPGVVVGAYPPGRWAHVRVTISLQTPTPETGVVGKMFDVRAEVHFQGAPAVVGSTVAYARLTDRLGPVRLTHRGDARPGFPPPPAPPFAPGYIHPPAPPTPPTPR
mmetsp:Transcript_10606/g.43935  ORF Transcript_10606/g.43935 Transcript_10606/m.43935 type:complete len:437 (-) Transcript_10606:3226-4536(-)